MKQLSTCSFFRPMGTLFVLSTMFLNFEGTVSVNERTRLMSSSFTSTFIGTFSHAPYMSFRLSPSCVHQWFKASFDGTSSAPAS